MPKVAKKKKATSSAKTAKNKKKTAKKAPPKKKVTKKAKKKIAKPAVKKAKPKAKPTPKPKPAPKAKAAAKPKPAPKQKSAPKSPKRTAPKVERVATAEVEEIEEPKKVNYKPRFSPEELKDIRIRLVGMLSSHQDEIKHEVFSASDRDLAHISDSSDIATDAAEGDLAFRLAETVGVEAAEIERAIEKIDENTYGYCDVCGKPIPMERLKFLPWATKLVEYQERHELRQKRLEDGELEDLEAGDDLADIS